MHQLSQALIFALACNLDTVLAALGQPRPPHRWEGTAVAVVTTLVTLLSLLLGRQGAALLPAALADRLGGLALLALGLWYLLDALRGRGGEGPAHRSGWLGLSAALAVNNAGVGVAAGVTGLDPILSAVCNFFLTLLALALGRRLGQELERWQALALPLSGGLLTLLGLWQLW